MTPLFVARMEDLLDLYQVYQAPFDSAHPVICIDELPVGLTAPAREAIPMRPGRIRREDYEYERQGSCSLFAAFQPLAGWRWVQARERRTAQDFAAVLKTLVDEHFPDATTIRLVLDNLNTHSPASLYATYPPAEARRIAARREWHYTPAHGSWLNMIEIEWSVLAQQCLGRHVPDMTTLQAEVDAWTQRRNAEHAIVRWRFTTPDARRAMHALYPAVPQTTDTTSPADTT